MSRQSIGIKSEPSLEVVRKQFERWRNSRTKMGPLPEPLWNAAVVLTQDHSLVRVSRALRINYNDLKKRTAPILSHSKSRTHTEFVELKVPQTAPRGQIHIEITRADGARMSVHLESEVDLPSLAKAFLDGS